jgi:hypothetical protein
MYLAADVGRPQQLSLFRETSERLKARVTGRAFLKNRIPGRGAGRGFCIGSKRGLISF